ncbi:MAG: transglycosylase SLT domain-containing protein, partial [Hyphomicrobiales bacterium]
MMRLADVTPRPVVRKLLLSALLALVLAAATSGARALETGNALSQGVAEQWTGDYDAMLKHRRIRVLIPFSKTFFFLDGGRRRGLAVEWLHEFEKTLQSDARSKKDHPVIFLIPTRRDQLISGLVEGRGDIAVANLTVTKERQKQVAFSEPFQRNVSEFLVTPKATEERQGIDSLSGLTVHVRPSSSYFQSLERRNAEFRKQGKPQIRIVKANELLEDEDLLEMVNAELIPAIVMDSHKVAFWSKVFDNIRVHEKVAVRTGGTIAWAFRKNSPNLRSKINAFAAKASSGTLLGNILLGRYYRKTGWLRKATAKANLKRLDGLVVRFQKYGARYNIDWLLLAALAFHESRLDQSATGPTGAVGIMQIKPSTAASRDVQISDVSASVDANIHAGTKYLRYLADRYFAGKDVDDFNRILFALASYNAGPSRIAGLRKKSRDPHVWFDSVEEVVSRDVGLIPVRYVLNIYQ